MSDPCPADAKSEEPRLPSSQEPQPIGSPPSLADAVLQLSEKVGQSNDLLMLLVQQNSALIEIMVDSEDPEAEPVVDMEGNPIRTS